MSLLKPFSTPTSATLLGWHAEGPFIDLTKRGAHSSAYLLEAPSGFQSLEEVYGPENLLDSERWTMSANQDPAVRLITAAPEVPGIMGALDELNKRGIAFSIGHRFVTYLLTQYISKYVAFLVLPVRRLPQPLYSVERD